MTPGAREEASRITGGAYEVCVLEPSPPAVTEPPFFADDPAVPGDYTGDLPLVAPVRGGDLLWSDLAAQDPSLAEFCSERWLGAYRRLEPLPASFSSTREGLHRVAETLFKPARERANGKFGLRYTRGGFGTPFFGEDSQLRVEGDELVVIESGEERRAPVSTLRDAAELIGPRLLPDAHVDDEPVEVDAAAGAALGDWYGFVCSVLEELRAEAGPADAPARVQLWPEHFDLATELGSEAASARANYGGSPGDAEHSEPYLYVGPWSQQPAGELWQAEAFPGAELSYSELLAAEDQRALALDFFRTRHEALV
jgi:hypothetical protein